MGVSVRLQTRTLPSDNTDTTNANSFRPPDASPILRFFGRRGIFFAPVETVIFWAPEPACGLRRQRGWNSRRNECRVTACERAGPPGPLSLFTFCPTAYTGGVNGVRIHAVVKHCAAFFPEQSAPPGFQPQEDSAGAQRPPAPGSSRGRCESRTLPARSRGIGLDFPMGSERTIPALPERSEENVLIVPAERPGNLPGTHLSIPHFVLTATC